MECKRVIISAIIITYNEERNIKDCLESLKWVDEIVVLDAKSSDKTAQIAEESGARVIFSEWQGYGRQKNYVLTKTTSEWILWIDADERVTPELAKEILTTLTNPSFSGYKIPRKAYFLGRWIRYGGWYPGYVLRLFRRDKGRFIEKEVHEYVQIEGRTGRLKSPLIHYTDDTLEHYFDKFCRYTTLAADELYKKGKNAYLSDILLRPIFIFFKMYIIKIGFLDGFHGLILAILSSFYVFTKYAKLWIKRK